MAEMILARIQRCRYCGREMSCSPLEYEQNPFCNICLSERVSNESPKGRIRWKTEGHYVIPEVSRKRPPNAHRRHQG